MHWATFVEHVLATTIICRLSTLNVLKSHLRGLSFDGINSKQSVISFLCGMRFFCVRVGIMVFVACSSQSVKTDFEKSIELTNKVCHFFLCAFQLVEPPKGFTFGTLKDSSMEDFFRKSQNPRLRKIYENMKTHNVEHFADGAKKVLSG